MGSISVSGLGTFSVPDSFASLPADQQQSEVEQMVAAVRGSGSAPAASVSPAQPGLLDRIGAGFSRGTQDLADTVDTVDSSVPVLNSLDRLAGGGSSPAVLAKDAAARQAYSDRYGNDTAASLGRFAGQTAVTLPLAAVTDGAASAVAGKALPGILQGLARGTAAGAVQGASTASGDGQSIGTGALDGAAMGGALAGGLSAATLAGAARSAAGAAAMRSAVARSALPGAATDADTAASVLRSQAMVSQARAAAPKATDAQAAATVTDQLQRGLNAHVSMLRQVGMVGADDAADLRAAISDAADPTKSGAGGQGTVDGLNLPAPLAQPLSAGLRDLNTISSGALQGPSQGPLRNLGALTAKYGAPVAAALTGLHAGDLAPAVEAGAGFLGIAARKPVSAVGGAVGGLADRLAGTRVDPGAAMTDAAAATLGGASPGASPIDQLAAVRSAYRDAQASAASDAQDAARAATIAKQTDAAWKANASTTNAAEDAWSKAEAQKARQVAAGAPDPLSSALWRDAEAATNSSPNLDAVTASQARGFQTDQAGFARRDSAEAAAEAAEQARGANLADSAGNWLERQQIAQFKQANPGVPVTGAAALSARGPAAVFDATGGRLGNPAGDLPAMNGIRPGQPAGTPPAATPAQGLSEAPPAAPQPPRLVSMPAGRAMASASLPVSPGGGVEGAAGVRSLAASGAAPAPAPTSAPTYGPFPAAPSPGGLVQPATGGQALAQMMHRQQFGGPAPSPSEMGSAIDDIAADGLVHPMEADAAHGGQNISPAFALTIAHRVQAARHGAASVSTAAAQQATSEVAGLNGSSGGWWTGGGTGAPFGTDGSGAAIRNPTAYAGAKSAYQAHAAQMIALAPTAEEKRALSEIAATPRSTDKQAVRDVYAAAHPGANLSRFTGALMRGTS